MSAAMFFGLVFVGGAIYATYFQTYPRNYAHITVACMVLTVVSFGYLWDWLGFAFWFAAVITYALGAISVHRKIEEGELDDL